MNTVDFRTMTIDQAREASRDTLIAFLSWNDPNGSFSDEDCALDDCEPLTHAELVHFACQQIIGSMDEDEYWSLYSRDPSIALYADDYPEYQSKGTDLLFFALSVPKSNNEA